MDNFSPKSKLLYPWDHVALSGPVQLRRTGRKFLRMSLQKHHQWVRRFCELRKSGKKMEESRESHLAIIGT
jgi:hypothetical protein